MKEHGSKLPAEQPAKILKSLLKKPGQSKSRSQKNRVVINEKLNEFFAADYIILIKEECCADYEEDCDCCCQEHELIRLGNCKECRAELNLHFGVSDNGQYHGISRDGEIVRENASRGQGCGAEGFDCVELHVEDEEEEEEEDLEEVEEDQEDDEETGEDAGEKQGCKACKDVETEERKSNDIEAKGKCKRIDGPKDVESRVEFVSPALKITLPSTPPPPPPPPPPPLPSTPPPSQASIERPSSTQPRQEHQQETLSPPEGYKDVYSNGEVANVGECCLRTSLDYLQCQRTTGAKIEGESRCNQEVSENNNENVEKTNEPSPKASINESRHRYLVETITMTTVTERRIVREISEEEDINLQHGRKSIRSERNVGETTMDNSDPSECNVSHEAQSSLPEKVISDTEEDASEDHSAGNETPSDMKELSLVFKLGNSSLTGNSLKPNSAVRQLFPNPRFVSPPPAPLAKLISSDSPDGPAFLVNAENLRLTNQGSLDVESTNPIRRTIERNTLRRSLLDKYRANSRKKALPTKNLSLEERIRQLTCVDQEEDNQNPTTDVVDSSTEIDADLPGQTDEALSSTKTFVHNGDKMSTTITALPATVHVAKFALSDTSASMPSAMASTATTVLASYSSLIVTTATATTTTTTTITGPNYYKQNTLAGGSTVMDNVHGQSTYKKLTDLFVHKRTSIHSNLPDLGIGSNGKNGNGLKDQQSKNALKTNNSDVRRQFLASLAPLSCVAVNNADAQEDYYRHNSRMMDNDSRSPSVNYNTLSPYGLEDIEAALREDDRNYQGPPDVTKGTPITANRPDIGDTTADELLAFVEQDKFRTERIKQRYNDAENQYNSMINSTNGYIGEDKVDRIIDGKNDVDDSRHENANRENNGNKNQMQFVNRRYSNSNDNNSANNDNDDDELNDYGFNRRPSVTGIKQRQSENNAEDAFHRRTTLENDNTNALRTNFHSSLPNYYENKVDGRLYEEMMDESMSNSFVGATEEQDANTINRINTMQKQIDDIYQTIVENTNVAGQNTMEQQPYTEDAYARHSRLPTNDPAYRFYQDPRNSQQQYFQEQLNIANARTARGIATGAEEIDGNTVIGNERDYANGLPPKARRREPIGTAPSNYRCNVMPTVYTAPPANGKCYRTMYFVPYNGLSDPTYQNIQRILPSHPSPSASYANHIERYPYPRANKNDPRLQAQPAPQQLRYYHVQGTHSPVPTLVQNDPQLPVGSLAHSVPPSSSPSFDSRLTSISSPNPIALQPAQQTLHLHLHHQQPTEDFRISGVAFASVPHNANHSLQLHHHAQHHPHHRHHHQPTFYRLPSTIPNVASSSSSYTVIAPSRCATFAGSEIATTDGSYRFYQVHLGRTVLTPSSSDLSAQTFLSSSNPQISVPSTSFSPSMPVSSSYSNTSLSSTFSLPTVTTVSPQQTNFIHPNHVPESGLGSNMDTVCRTGSVQSIPNNPVVSTPSTTSGFSAATSCALSSSSSSSSTSSSSYSFSSPSSSSSSCSSSSSLQIPSSPSKLQQQQMIGTYATIERGVPEGAASAPSYDVSQAGILLTANPYAAHNSSGVQNLPTHAQNSVYYAMNV